MFSFCHVVTISSKYILNNVGKRGQLWHTPLLISATFDNMQLYFTTVLFRVCMFTTAFNNVSEISNKIWFCILSNAFTYL